MFPARKLGGASSGGGEWLVAYRAAEKERCHAILSAFPKSLSPPSRRTINTPMSPGITPLIFSRAFLLDLHGVSCPQDLCIARVSGMGLSEWKEEDEFDMEGFVNLTEIDASDNLLQLEAFFQLTALACLDLSVNQISHVTLHEDSLNKLQILDLSGNSMDIQSILSIGLLVSLRELHLSGNELSSLPEEMARQLISVDNFGNVICKRDRFPLLQKLWLDHNQFEEGRIFAILAGMKQLEYLNLSNNKIFSLPHLHFLPKEVVERLEEGVSLLDSEEQTRLVNPANSVVEERDITTESTSRHKNDGNLDNLAKILSDISVMSRQSPRHLTAVAVSGVEQSSQTKRPFPSLVELDLSHNKLYYPGDVVACAKWKTLKHIKIQGNPIASQQKGLHPILQTELVGRGKEVTVTESSLGEKAKRRANKLSVITAMTAPLKINETLPPLPAKRPLPLTLNRDVTNLMNERVDVYSQSSSVTPVSQTRTYAGPSPQGSGTSLFPYLPARERRPCTVVTGEMNELIMPVDSPHYKHRRHTIDTDSQSVMPSHSQTGSRETFFMTQSDQREVVDTDFTETGDTYLTSRNTEDSFSELLPSECIDELKQIFTEREDDKNFTSDTLCKNINSTTRQLARLLQHPPSLPALTYDSDNLATLDTRYNHCVKRRERAVSKKEGSVPSPKAITYANTTEREVEVEYSLDEAMKKGGDRDKRDVQKLFASLQSKYNKLRTSSHYQNDKNSTQIPLSTQIQHSQVY